MKFYKARSCPYAQRAAIALGETLDMSKYETVITNKPALYTEKVNPAGTVPTLELDSGKLIYDSSNVAEFVLEKFGGNSRCVPCELSAKKNLKLALT